MIVRQLLQHGLIASFALTLLGCAHMSLPEFDPSSIDEIKEFPIATRQSPREPAYGRLRYAQLPQVLPPRSLSAQELHAPQIEPVVEFSFQDTSLEQVAEALANISRYRSYTANSIADKRISIEAVGTMRQLADRIEDAAGIDVLIDHGLKTVRFLSSDLPQYQGG